MNKTLWSAKKALVLVLYLHVGIVSAAQDSGANVHYPQKASLVAFMGAMATQRTYIDGSQLQDWSLNVAHFGVVNEDGIDEVKNSFSNQGSLLLATDQQGFYISGQSIQPKHGSGTHCIPVISFDNTSPEKTTWFCHGGQVTLVHLPEVSNYELLIQGGQTFCVGFHYPFGRNEKKEVFESGDTNYRVGEVLRENERQRLEIEKQALTWRYAIRLQPIKGVTGFAAIHFEKQNGFSVEDDKENKKMLREILEGAVVQRSLDNYGSQPICLTVLQDGYGNPVQIQSLNSDKRDDSGVRNSSTEETKKGETSSNTRRSNRSRAAKPRCGICGNEPSQYDVNEYKTIKTSASYLQCECCGGNVFQTSHLKKRKRPIGVKKTFKCQYCEKAFRQNIHRKRHERLHTGEKPYECKVCGKTFSQKFNMQKHESNCKGSKISEGSSIKSISTGSNINRHFEHFRESTVPVNANAAAVSGQVLGSTFPSFAHISLGEAGWILLQPDLVEQWVPIGLLLPITPTPAFNTVPSSNESFDRNQIRTTTEVESSEPVIVIESETDDSDASTSDEDEGRPIIAEDVASNSIVESSSDKGEGSSITGGLTSDSDLGSVSVSLNSCDLEKLIEDTQPFHFGISGSRGAISPQDVAEPGPDSGFAFEYGTEAMPLPAWARPLTSKFQEPMDTSEAEKTLIPDSESSYSGDDQRN